jgi:hypothetical protein
MLEMRRDTRDMSMALRGLQGTVAGAAIGLVLFVVGLRLSGFRPVTDRENGRLILAFLAPTGASATVGAIAGAVVGGRSRR